MMKKISQLFLIVCLILLNVQFVSAAAKSWSDTEYDFSKAHKLLIVEPNYNFAEGNATSEEIMNMLYEQAAKSLHMFALNTEDIERNILRDTSIDLAKLKTEDEKQAQTVFENEFIKYTDLYLVATIVHNSRVMIFYDVYSTQTKQPVFTYQIVASSTDPDNLMTYKQLTKSFYREFNKAINKSMKDKK